MKKTSAIRSAQKVIRAAIKSKTVTLESHAIEIAKKMLPELENFEIAGVISDLMPRNIGKVFSERTFAHEWFKGKVTHTVYWDTFNRMWSRTTGTIKKTTPIARCGKEYYIDALGGMMWDSRDGKTFICEYRTDKEEVESNVPKPEFFHN